MGTIAKSGLGCFRRAPLAAQLVGMFALADTSASFAATTWTVNTCSNASTNGTLRDALNHAGDGDTVDMTGLACSTISLTESGTPAAPLTTASGTITVLGPGRDNLTISGGGAVQVFYHSPLSANPTFLVLKDMTLSDGLAAYDYLLQLGRGGGCIDMYGNITLDRVTVTGCHATSSGGGINAGGVTLDHATVTQNVADDAGAGIYANSVNLTSSVVSSNHATGNGGGIRAGTVGLTSSVVSSNKAGHNGGGIWGTDVALTDSAVSGNIAGYQYSGKQGGGMFVGGNLTLTRSTIDSNFSYGFQGGIVAFNSSPGSLTATIVDSTISDNNATAAIGGIYVNSGDLKVYNSTIASNHSGVDSALYAAGLATGTYYGNMSLNFHAALITNNFGGATPRDFTFAFGGHSFGFSGANNFVRYPDSDHGVFSHEGGCPRLGPLRDNGGPTRTHALLSGSQAINDGDNVNGLPNDQRGAPFARAVGIPDIGAYEVQQEIVFNAGFDDC